MDLVDGVLGALLSVVLKEYVSLVVSLPNSFAEVTFQV